MKHVIFTAIVAMALAVSAQQSYQLVWSDEFNGNSLDLSKWQYEVNCDGGGNNELQCYTGGTRNIAVRDGNLVITARVEDYNGKKYTSGRINTKNTAAWKYGRFEARARLPEGIYAWPALWMMPRDSVYGSWAASGEIDIMENRGGQNTEHSSTLHFGAGWPNNKYEGSGSRYASQDLTKDFHVYACEWTPQSIKFFIDGVNFHTMQLSSRSYGSLYNHNGAPFDQYFFFIINFAVGGGFFGANANALTQAQARAWPSPNFYVDYVRVYQLKDGVNPNPVPAPSSVPTPTPTPSTTSGSTGNNNGGCASGACGGASCCNDQNNGQQCYNAGQYSCPVDGATNKNQLCPTNYGACNKACYDPNTYHCANGGLQPGKGANTPAPTPSTYNPPATTKSDNCQSGSATCEDAVFGSQCYVTSGQFACVKGNDNKNHLCPKNTLACGSACYPTSKYQCVNGWLSPTK